MMANITKIAAVETTTAIWEYDPSLPNNCMLNSSLDVIAAIRMLAIKVCFVLSCLFFLFIHVVDKLFPYTRFSH